MNRLGPPSGPDDLDGPRHPTVAALVLVIGVVLFIVAMSVASVYF